MDDKQLLNHGEDLAERAGKTGWAASRFLTPGESELLRSRFAGRKDIRLSFEGGFAGAERLRAVFLQPDWGNCSREELLTGIRIGHRSQDSLGHRDILGALMNLGIVRETIGDICVGDGQSFFVCLPEIASFVLEQLERVGRVGVVLTRIPLTELPEREEALEEKAITVSSLRLDVLIGGIFNLSRGRASEAVAQGLARVDHRVCLKPDKDVAEGSLLAVRGLGRARILRLEGSTRKERLRVLVGLYE